MNKEMGSIRGDARQPKARPAKTEDETEKSREGRLKAGNSDSSTIQKFWLWWKPLRGRRSLSLPLM
ncbi:MAG: hypothetical protein ACTSWV_00830 [Candidatus Asgardarchaeia archaeon]